MLAGTEAGDWFLSDGCEGPVKTNSSCGLSNTCTIETEVLTSSSLIGAAIAVSLAHVVTEAGGASG